MTTLPLRPANTGGLALIPTWFADLAVTAAPLLVAALWRKRAVGLAAALAAITLAAIVLSGTRSVLLALAGLGLVTVMILIDRRRGGVTVAAAAVASIAIGTAAALVLLASPRALDEGRFSAYGSAVERFTESPLFGGGPGTYGVRRMSETVDGFGYRPSVPTALGMAPDVQNWLLPDRYPSYVWRLDHPHRPYVAGSWTYRLGRPACVATAALG